MKKWLKKSVVIVMVLLLTMGVFSMAGCENNDQPTENNDTVVSGSVFEEMDTQGADDTSIGDDTQNIAGEITADETKEDTEEKEAFVMPSFDDASATSMWTTVDVKFRTEPNTECEVIKVLSAGTEVMTCEVKASMTGTDENGEATASKLPDGWAFVKVDDKLGFVSEKYLTDQKPEIPSAGTAGTKIEAIPGQHRDPNNIVVCIDPGHQGKGDSTKEPNGPGSSTMKARVTSGTQGEATGVAEYVMNLEISLMLREELQNRGYTVYMTRTTHDVNISNMERAQYSTQVGADIAIRVHCNSVDNSSVRGAETMAPSTSNPYVAHLANASQSLSRHVIDQYCAATGFKNRGVQIVDNMTGINWSEIPVTIIELGFMSNPEEDVLMQDSTVKNNMVQGMANGIDAYFGLR